MRHKMTQTRFNKLFDALRAFRGEGAFNQYAETDPELDLPGADRIRLANLALYLDAFRDAKNVLVGEAPSFNGCRFSGIPFTSEELLMGRSPLPWADGLPFKRTSMRDRLMVEHSASIVWELISGRKDIVLWNAFPWHPYKPGVKDRNRKPAIGEIEAASGALRIFTGLYPDASVYAVGRTAEHALAEIGIHAEYIRHPARGGKPLFTEGVSRIGTV